MFVTKKDTFYVNRIRSYSYAVKSVRDDDYPKIVFRTRFPNSINSQLSLYVYTSFISRSPQSCEACIVALYLLSNSLFSFCSARIPRVTVVFVSQTSPVK